MNATQITDVRTIGDLLRRLGDVPADRVRFHPPPGHATLEDLYDPENAQCELVDRTLVEKAMGVRESLLAVQLSTLLQTLVQTQNLGLITGEQGAYDLCGLVRMPDIAFVSWDRLPNRRVPDDPVPDVAPDLAVEILSKRNTPEEMARKRREYFEAGVRVVWEIDPRARTVRVFTEPEGFLELSVSDTLTAEPVIPGFSLPLAVLFAELDRHG